MSTNVVVVTGNLGQNPNVKEANRVPFCRFSIANNERYKKDGKIVNRVTWVSVVAFSNVAKSLAPLQKGDRVTVLGKLRTGERSRKDGSTSTVLEVHATSVDFLDVKRWKTRPTGAVEGESAGDDLGEFAEDLEPEAFGDLPETVA